MEYRSRTFRIDDEVWDAVQKHELSANKLLRVALGLDVSEKAALVAMFNQGYMCKWCQTWVNGGDDHDCQNQPPARELLVELEEEE